MIVEAYIVGCLLMGVDGAHDDIGIDLNDMIIPEILNQTMPDMRVGIIDEYLMLMTLRCRRIIYKILTLTHLTL